MILPLCSGSRGPAWVALLLIALLAPLPSCAQRDGVVRAQGPGARLVLTEVLRLGSVSGDEAFGRVMDVELGPTGRIYVADDLSWNVVAFDGAGRLLRRVGRRGQGPGEFERPWYLAVDRYDSLFVWDGALARISVFGPDFRFARSFPAPGPWTVSGFSVRPDGTLLVGAFAPGAARSIHVLARDGRVLRSLGPSADAAGIPEGFASSLLGGSVHESNEGIVFSRRSPYELVFHDRTGRRLRSCRGDARWTTPPRTVVRVENGQQALEWQRFVHSTGAISLGGGYYLNELLDPDGQSTTLDLVRANCALAHRRVHDGVLGFRDRRGDLLVARVGGEVPQVALFRYRIERVVR
ncbi:6-bladed beta-propeller [Longimicrobium sp.]|uniref:6-bladed beta-propeller n=1 Tax=Longimicrobium sp. TaxID=2029185 RepID=UPI003B3A375C